MAQQTDSVEVPCPRCPATIVVERPERARTATCPSCRTEWEVRLQDTPGSRFVVRLTAFTG